MTGVQDVREGRTGATRPDASFARRAAPTAVPLLLLVLVTIATLLSLRTPSPEPASAPPAEFSAGRATALLGSIAAVPHPSGSPAAATVRAFLVDSLGALGLQPQVQTRTVARPVPGRAAAVGTVSNVHARIPGTAPTGRVLLVAHYDSVPTGPGAFDDGANVAALLEVARALRSGPAPRNDIDVLFTDAEEVGLLGAQAFAASGLAGDPQRVVVVNLEARGVSGPAVLFQTVGDGLTTAVRAGGAVTTSLSDAVYQALPSDTDLTVLAEAGMRGLNLAVVGGAAAYHTPQDDIAHVDPGSVQDMGDTALAMARHLAAGDLTVRGSAATTFSLFGTTVSYPARLVGPLGALAAVGYVLLLVRGRRHGLSVRAVLRTASTLPLVAVVAVAVGLAGWVLLTLVRPDVVLRNGFAPYAGRYVAAEATLVVAALVTWYRWVRRRAGAVDVAAGALGWCAAGAAVLAVLLPGGAYLLTWPTLVGVVAVGAACRLTPPASRWRGAAASVPALTAVILVLPVGTVLVPTLGLSLAAAPLLLLVLPAALCLAVVERPTRPRAWTVGTVAVAVTALAALAVVPRVAPDDGLPRPASLGYVLEADTGTATWVSAGGPDQPVVGRLLTAGPVRFGDRVPSIARWELTGGPAPAATGLAGPRVDSAEIDDGIDGVDGDGGDGGGEVRTARLRVRMPDDAYRVDVYVGTTTYEVLGATVGGVELPGGRPRAREGGDLQWGFRYSGPAAGAVDVVLRLRGEGPLTVRLVSCAAGLPAGVGAPTLPADVGWTSWPVVAGETFVARTVRL